MPERVIVNYGVYQLSLEEREAFRLRVYTQVERKPETPYENFKYQKPQSFYGYAQLMFGQWVYGTIQLQYETELLWEFTNDTAQLAILLYCSTQQTRDNIIALSTCIPACDLDTGNPPIQGLWKCPIDRIVFKLAGTTTLLVNTDLQQFANPCATPLIWGDDAYTPPEPSSTDVPPNPLDPPYDIPDAPYGEPDDDGETYNPQRPPEPIDGGGENRNYNVTVTFTRQSWNSVTEICTVTPPEQVAQIVPGPVFGLAVRTEPTFKRLVVIAAAGAGNPTPTDYSVITGGINSPPTCNGFPAYEITSLIPL